MKFKVLGLSAVATTAIVVGSTLATAPAHALTGKFAINLNGRVNSVTSTGIDLNQAPGLFGFTEAPTGDFSSYTGAQVTDLAFGTTLVNGSSNPDININLPSFITLTGGSLGTITFDLTQLTKVVFSDIDAGGTQGSFSANLKGIFQPSGSSNSSAVDAIASFRLDQNSNGGAIELTAVPVPTPALLPGLVGMGLAAIRKRKAEASEEVGAEA